MVFTVVPEAMGGVACAELDGQSATVSSLAPVRTAWCPSAASYRMVDTVTGDDHEGRGSGGACESVPDIESNDLKTRAC